MLLGAIDPYFDDSYDDDDDDDDEEEEDDDDDDEAGLYIHPFVSLST